MGLLVDVPRLDGSGTSNDENTERRFFANPHLTSTTTGINKEVIKRFGIILQVISSGYKIDVQLFDNYAIETAKLFVIQYFWFYLPASVHTILLHGSIIIENALLPIGLLSEEAQEARIKDIKKYREHRTRKISLVKTMEDLFSNLLVSSGP
ncbi:Hypothetical protein CINCED_3A005506 [Cinara cedri]|uniref:Uncharacterized protein n=1 Tax=Cinara cedri TaxID=506608 RepID=A0A5E4M6U8_9HEMI|nr:Hypothetical protein CINCED_3A005506 [Cinara cedri]